MEQKINKQRLAIMFRILREVAGLAQREVAEKMGVTQQGYGCIESGKSIPQIATIIRFCDILKIGPIHFFDHFLKDEIPFTHASAEQVFEISGISLEVSELPSRVQYFMKMIRIVKEMKQEDVAFSFSITQQAYSHIETTLGDVSDGIIKKFCDVVRVDVGAFKRLVENTKEPLTWSNISEFITKNSI